MCVTNPQILYTGAQVLFRSLNRGDHGCDEMRIDSGYVPFCTITSISERH